MDETQKTVSVDEIFAYLKRGEKEIAYIKDKKLILVIGVTGTGKSTLIQVLTTDNSRLMAVSPGTPGQYLIEDQGGRISKDTINSKTEFPEAFSYGENLLIDCQGFSDTRSVKYDIGGTYILKKLINNASKVAMLFVINHNTVEQGASRVSFRTFINHGTTFVEDINKYKDSMGFVISKVNNTFIPEFKPDGTMTFSLISDEVLIRSVVLFLNEIQTTLESDDPKAQKKWDAFLETMLAKDAQDNVKNLALFRKPDRSGSLKDSVSIQTSKTAILKIIDGLKFVAPHPNDFNLSITDKSRLELIKISEQLKNVTLPIFDDLKRGILDHHNKNYFNDKFTIPKTYAQLSEEHANLQLKLKLNADVGTIDHFISNVIKNFIEETKISQLHPFRTSSGKDTTISDQLKELIEQGEKLQMFQNVIDSKKEQYTPKGAEMQLFEATRQFSEELGQMLDSSSLLVDLLNLFSSYEIQMRKPLFDTLGLQTWVETPVNIESFADFLAQISSQLPLFQRYKNTKIFDTMVELVNTFLKTLTEPSTERLDDTLKISGNFVGLSTLSNTDLSGVNNVQIFGLLKIFIDEDVSKSGTKMKLVLMAPEIEIVNERVIDISGTNASHQYPTNARNASITSRNRKISKSETRTDYYPTNAADGTPGLPGGAAGTVCIWTMLVGKTGSLLVNVNGGNGGNAQHGGSGYDHFYRSSGQYGGNGGKQGMGGPAGEFKFNIPDKSAVQNIQVEESSGNAGNIGEGGRGGSYGGRKGIDNHNTYGYKQAESAGPGIDESAVLRDFKQLASKSLETESGNIVLQNFVNQL